jgi:phosphatidylglycerophosphate synthase
VTGLSALCSFVAIVLLAVLDPSWLLGAVAAALLVLGYALDSADGQLARLQGSSSPAGEWLDHVVDSAKIVCLHAAVLLQLQRWDGLGEAWSLVPLAFMVVASVSFFTMILNEQLRRRAGAGPARAGARPSALRALLALPTDYGVLCCAFLLLGSGLPFLALYSLLLAGTAGHLALALPVWRREMLTLGGPR